MFDIGFAELLLVAVVGLLVLGPERLPEAIRTGAAWLNRLRRGFNDVKREIQQELHNDAVMRELRDTDRQLKQGTRSPGDTPPATAGGAAPPAPPPAPDAGPATVPQTALPDQAPDAAPPASPDPSAGTSSRPERDGG